MKENICTIVGVLGGFVAMLLGGWDTALITLVIFMAVDFITGIIGAALGKSKHSWTGRLSSKAGWYGLAKKFCTLLIIVAAVRIDILIGTTYVRDATCIGFCVNELLSIVENTSLMGVPYPDAIKKAIDVLQKKAGKLNVDASDILDALDDENEKKKYNTAVFDLRP